MKLTRNLVISSALLLLLSQPAWARLKLVTLPDRQATQVQLENDNDTLLSEERELNLQAGVTQVDFAWQNVQIQPQSIRLSVLEQQEPVQLLNVSYPPSAQALVWEIASPKAQTVRVRISYLLQNIDRLVTYQGNVNKAETELNLLGFVVLRNFSGEDLSETQFQFGQDQSFTGSVRDKETKRVQFSKVDKILIQKRFIFDARILPWEPELAAESVGIPVLYEFKNTPENALGLHPLLAGKARLFIDDGKGGQIFLGEDQAAFTPVGEKIRLNIGNSRDVVVTQRKLSETRVSERRNNKNQVVLYDMETVMQVTLENFREQPALVTVKESMPDEWTMQSSSLPFEKQQHDLIEFDVTIPAKDKLVLDYSYVQQNVRP